MLILPILLFLRIRIKVIPDAKQCAVKLSRYATKHHRWIESINSSENNLLFHSKGKNEYFVFHSIGNQNYKVVVLDVQIHEKRHTY